MAGVAVTARMSKVREPIFDVHSENVNGKYSGVLRLLLWNSAWPTRMLTWT